MKDFYSVRRDTTEFPRVWEFPSRFLFQITERLSLFEFGRKYSNFADGARTNVPVTTS